jgi:hypothetical protein
MDDKGERGANTKKGTLSGNTLVMKAVDTEFL